MESFKSAVSKGQGFHVVLLMEYPTLNGGERSTLAFCRQLTSQGFRFTAIAPDRDPLKTSLRDHNVSHVPFSFTDPSGTRLTLDQLRKNLTLKLKGIECDLLHSISLSTARIAGPVADFLNLPSIGHIRDIVRISKQAMHDVNKNSHLLAVSDATLDYHRREGLCRDRSTRLYNGIDLSIFKPRPQKGQLHRSLGIPIESKLLGAAGQLSMRKGLDTLIRAFEIVSRSHKHLHLVVAGERHSQKSEAIAYERSIKGFISQHQLSDRVHFLGYQQQMQYLYSELSIFVHCAHQEPLGRVLLEAAGCGIPIIATDVGGTREIFTNSTEAILIAAGDPDNIAGCVSKLMIDPTFATLLGSNAHQRVSSFFNISNLSVRLRELYRQVIGGRRPVDFEIP